MKILWLIALLLTSGCSTRANSNYIAQEVRTFYSGMLNGEEISITCEDRDYKTAFFKEMNKNLHKKEFKDIDSYVVKKNLDIAYTMRKDNKIMRCYHGNMKTGENSSLKYFLTISVPNNDLSSPRVEKSTFTFSDKRKVAVSIEVNQGDHYCNAVVKDTKTKKTYKEFKYCFDTKVGKIRQKPRIWFCRIFPCFDTLPV